MDHQCFGESWNTFKQAVSASQNCDQQLLDDRVLSNDDSSYLFANLLAGGDQGGGIGGVILRFNGRRLDQSKTC